MRKRIKNISVLFLWLAGLLFISHVIAPHHHHHFDSDFAHEQQAGHSDEHSENIPLQCHAFIDFAIIKAGISSNKISDNSVDSDIVVKNDIRFQYAEIPFDTITFSDQDDGLPSSDFLKNSPTRGSPAIV